MKKHIANCITGIGMLCGVVACILVLLDPSWFWAEILLAGALIMDALDGKAARKFGSTKIGPYLDDGADFINFGIHPALWIWVITGSIGLSILFVCCIFYRLVRFTLKQQNTENYISGLPSPAAAIAAMGIMIVRPEPVILAIGIGMVAFLAISNIPCMHVMKTEKLIKFAPLVGLLSLNLPWIYGGNLFAVGLTQTVLVLIYILISIIFLLIPHYVFR